MDVTSISSVEHYKDCEQMASANVKVIANIDRESLSNLYEKASIYIHATGMNIESNVKNQNYVNILVLLFSRHYSMDAFNRTCLCRPKRSSQKLITFSIIW